MAEVFQAKTYGVEGFERFVAVKRILPSIAEDEEFISMFIDEAKIAVQLNHANVAQIFDLGKVEDSYFIALEYVHGKDLRAIFDRCGSEGEIMPLPQACFIIMKICEGLDYAHNKRDSSGQEMGLVHRDVSPQNILISYDGEVKLVDFGIAKAVGKASKTQAGILKGKFGYMSPEQVRGLTLDRRSDIFSMGIVLYELITGERLFHGESDFSTLEKVRNVEILPPSTYNRKIPEELEQIVLKTLSREVDDRYEYAIDLHDDLQAFMYSSGAFYSRKDLAGWMKQTFTKEISREDEKLDAFRQMPPPDEEAEPLQALAGRQMPPPIPGANGGNGHPALAAPVQPPPMPLSAGPARGPLPPAPPPLSDVMNDLSDISGLEPISQDQGPALTWDDDEVETQIYDKPSPSDFGFGPPTSQASQDLIAGLPPDSPAEVIAPASPTLEDQTPEPEELPPPPAGMPLPGDLPPLADVRDLSPLSPDLSKRPMPHPTLQVQPMPAMLPSSARRVQPKNRLALWLSLALITVVLCTAALFYFLVLGKRPGNITVAAIPSDVTVSLDGKEQPSSGTPLTIRNLGPGYYIISAHKPGYERWTETVKVEPGETTSLNPRLEPLATAAINLRSNIKGGSAYLDGRKLGGKTPMRISRVTPGRHRIEVRMPPWTPWVHEFEIRTGQTVDLHAKLQKAEAPPAVLPVKVKLTSDPRAMAYLIHNGQRRQVGQTPVELSVKPQPGVKYMVALSKDGFKEALQELEFNKGGNPLKVAVLLEREPPPPAPEPVPEPVKKAAPEPKPEPKPVVVAPKPKPVAKPKPRPKPVAVAPKPRPKPVIKPRPRPKPVIKPKPRPRPRPKPVAKVTGTGTLLVGSVPWTKIYIDGKDTGFTTPRKIPLPAGRHKLNLRNEKFSINKTFKITIRPDETTKIKKKFPVSTP